MSRQCPWIVRVLAGSYYCVKRDGHRGSHLTAAGYSDELCWELPERAPGEQQQDAEKGGRR